MFVFGHAGLTAAAVRAVDREADLRLPLALAVLPDLIDKPVAFLMPSLVNANTRGFGHSLAGAAVVLAALVAARRRVGDPFLPWACYVGHLVLDRVWLGDGAAILFWPLLGGFPPPVKDPALAIPLLAYNVACEALGLGVALALWRRRGSR